jgi:hypothetical protein
MRIQIKKTYSILSHDINTLDRISYRVFKCKIKSRVPILVKDSYIQLT